MVLTLVLALPAGAADVLLSEPIVIRAADAGGLALAHQRAFALELVNEARRLHGLAPLDDSRLLRLAAQRHADDMAANGYFGHVSPSGITLAERYFAAGGKITSGIAENIAHCPDCTRFTVAEIQQFHVDWMASGEHRANMFNPKMTHFGFGIASNPDHGTYAVALFAAKLGGEGVSR